jgi:hypothetical protein
MPRRACPVKLQLWTERLQAFRTSGLSVAEFCKNLPCSPNSFYQWKRRIEANHEDSLTLDNNSKPSVFLPVIVRQATELSLSIQLPNGVAIQVPCHATDAIRLVIEQVA